VELDPLVAGTNTDLGIRRPLGGADLLVVGHVQPGKTV
jgi:hypothetical protein